MFSVFRRRMQISLVAEVAAEEAFKDWIFVMP